MAKMMGNKKQEPKSRGSFVCSKCGDERCSALLSSGKICKVCKGFKNHCAKSIKPMTYDKFKEEFFFRRHREAMRSIGFGYCTHKSHWVSLKDKWQSSGSLCQPCYLERKKQRYYSTENRRKQYKRENRRRRQQHAHVQAWREMMWENSPYRLKRLQQDEHVKDFRRWNRNAPLDERGDHWQRQGMPWRDRRLPADKRYRLRWALDNRFSIKERMRRQITKAKKRDGISEVIRGAIRRGGKSNAVERELGYSIDDLCLHLEKQFTKGMTWDKFKQGEIHIDHIVPQKEFDLSDDDEWRACWSLSNLRPCWARDNLVKSGKREFLI